MKQTKTLGGLLLAVGTLGTFSLAQDVTLDAVMVSANKMEESLQDIPQSITIIDEITLEEKGIKTIKDIIEHVPNMSATALDGTYVNFRGLNSSIFTNNNPVVIYIDGVPHTDRFGFDASLANVERVEVLRGPQGTLYGKDALGAVINIVTKTPPNRWSGTLGTEYGSNGHTFLLGNMSGPVVEDVLHVGVNGQLLQDDGWITNVHPTNGTSNANKERDRKFSAYALYTPHERFRAKLTLSKDYFKQHWFDGKRFSDPLNAKRDEAKQVSFDVPTHTKVTSFAQSLALTYDTDAMRLDAITTHKRLTSKSHIDQDFGDDPMYENLVMFGETTSKTLTQEVRLSSQNDGGVRWVGGVYGEKEKIDKGPFGEQFPALEPTEANFVSKNEAQTLAGFGQVVVPLVEDVELTVGGRYQRIKKKIDLDAYYKGLTSGVYYNADFSSSSPLKTPFLTQNGRKTWNAFLPKVALNYRINDTWSAYVSASKGYMPGGFNYIAFGGTAHENSFRPQTSMHYEIGTKATFSRGFFSAAIFRMNIENIHIYKIVGPGMYLTSNAKKAHSQGIEFEGKYLLTNTVEVSGSVGFIQAKYDDYDSGVKKYDGKRIENTPAQTASLGVAYIDPSGFYSRVDMRYQGSTVYYDQMGSWSGKTKDFFVADVKIGYRFSEFEVYGYVKNITNEEYITSIWQAQNVIFGDKRTFGLGVRYTF